MVAKGKSSLLVVVFFVFFYGLGYQSFAKSLSGP
jgi:hypothetical protein